MELICYIASDLNIHIIFLKQINVTNSDMDDDESTLLIKF